MPLCIRYSLSVSPPWIKPAWRSMQTHRDHRPPKNPSQSPLRSALRALCLKAVPKQRAALPVRYATASAGGATTTAIQHRAQRALSRVPAAPALAVRPLGPFSIHVPSDSTCHGTDNRRRRLAPATASGFKAMRANATAPLHKGLDGLAERAAGNLLLARTTRRSLLFADM